METESSASDDGIAQAFERAAKWSATAGKPQARATIPLIAPDVPTFAEVDRRDLSEISDDIDVAILGAPYEGYIARDRDTVYAPGTVPRHHHDFYSRSGAWDAPNAIRAGSVFYSFRHSNGFLMERATEIGARARVVDLGNLDVDHTDADYVVETISDATHRVASVGAVPILLGGDHSISFPSVLGIAKATGKRIGVISMDAHLDLSWQPSFSHSSQWARLMEAGVLRPEDFVLVGSRGVRNDPTWVKAAEELGVNYFTMDAIEQRGVVRVMRDAIAIALASADILYLSVDIDVVDPAFCPAQKYPDSGGLTTREIIAAVREAAGSRLCGMDLCCLGPTYDIEGLGSILAARTILEGIAGVALAGPVLKGSGSAPR